jgi:6-phosphofructokinase 1
MLAGPRAKLWKEPSAIRAAVVTGGGVAPGLNRVIHSIVRRHYDVYGLKEGKGGIVYGIRDGFRGLSEGSAAVRVVKLTPEQTREWMDRGGTMLGSVREDEEEKKERDPDRVASWYDVFEGLDVDVVYVIGGDGSQRAAHALYNLIAQPETKKELVVAAIPKTMDNDILWTDRSFGFQSTVDEAAHVIEALREDARSTCRLCIIEFFGRASGFVAASASLASGCVDAVLVPEEYEHDHFNELEVCKHLRKRIGEHRKEGEDYAVIVVAEGKRKGSVRPKSKVKWVEEDIIGKGLKEGELPKGKILRSEPRHLIRAIPPNPSDRVYCERLADLAVDNALAGFTGFVVTEWMSRFVLVPLRHVAGEVKTVDMDGLFWKEVVNSTGQPAFA